MGPSPEAKAGRQLEIMLEEHAGTMCDSDPIRLHAVEKSCKVRGKGNPRTPAMPRQQPLACPTQSEGQETGNHSMSDFSVDLWLSSIRKLAASASVANRVSTSSHATSHLQVRTSSKSSHNHPRRNNKSLLAYNLPIITLGSSAWVRFA
ncbi:uncharacterized protein LOC144981558 [Oryzias latipes]